MGYTTDFYGSFALNKPLDDELFDYLKKFSSTRRMKRDGGKLKKMYGEDFGVEGEFFVEGIGFKGQEKDDSVLDSNCPPSTQPGLWCQWVPSPDKKHIQWDGMEKFYEADEWIRYLVTNILQPRGYILNGLVAAKGESTDDFWYIELKDNKVIVLEGWDDIVLENPPNVPVLYILKNDQYYYAKKNDYAMGTKIESTWSLLDNEADYYQLTVFQTKEDAEEVVQKIKLRTLLDVSPTPIETVELKEHFIVLGEDTRVRERRGTEELPVFGIKVDPVYDFEKYAVVPLYTP